MLLCIDVSHVTYLYNKIHADDLFVGDVRDVITAENQQEVVGIFTTRILWYSNDTIQQAVKDNIYATCLKIIISL